MKSFRKMVMTLGAMCAISVALDIHAQTPMQEAANLGNGKGQSIYSNVTSKLPDSTTVPGYNGTDQQQKNYYQDGKGELVGPGVNRAGGCVSQGDPECSAVNMLQWGPNNRPTPTFSANDPLITGARSKLANSKGSLGSFGTAAGTTAGALSQTSTQCETKSIVKPATYESTVCDLTAQLENKSCNIDRVMKVDATYDYTCEKASQRKTVQTCNKTLNVTCSGATPQNYCPSGTVPYNGLCRSNTSSTTGANFNGYTCPSGYTPNGSLCSTTTIVGAAVKQECPDGLVPGYLWDGTNGVLFLCGGPPGLNYYYDPSGYWYYIYFNYFIESECARYISMGWRCIKTGIYNMGDRNRDWKLFANRGLSCPSGTYISGSTCVTTTTIPANPQYGCNPGGTLNSNNTCTYILTVDSNPNVSYSCPTTGVLTATGAINGTPTYSCCVDTLQNSCLGLEGKAL